jgi:hypothetical protein
LLLNLNLIKKLFFLPPRPPEKIMETPETLSAWSFILAEAVHHKTSREWILQQRRYFSASEALRLMIAIA